MGVGSGLYAQSVTGVATSRLAGADDLDDLAALHAEVLGDRVLLEDTRELCLLEAVALEQGDLLLPTEEDVTGYELVVRDVDEKVLLEEPLDGGPLGELGDLLLGRGRHGHVRYQDPRAVVLLRAKLAELAHVLRSQRVLVVELDPYRANFGFRFRA